ncbi:LOW QUALITY PROTEIN: hypothetical protein BU14_0164s0034 [Porphyra umbilicalis]|uniref:Uncharacterized protein n=1 Tax=Porphyra umbilicalis TaxID=2786 RepID=A0A1X6P895_PORUM|nr:LOW QUALITY PROTEIN: hypothetical protein BU14_0164s0034 [Porphyra umbilicalis]|eukprot:OSX77074.1 LOW QUALITY PROTEIN: hypothetical protein BU14_0164s0034 [Porphyra umbilicalis]
MAAQPCLGGGPPWQQMGAAGTRFRVAPAHGRHGLDARDRPPGTVGRPPGSGTRLVSARRPRRNAAPAPPSLPPGRRRPHVALGCPPADAHDAGAGDMSTDGMDGGSGKPARMADARLSPPPPPHLSPPESSRSTGRSPGRDARPPDEMVEPRPHPVGAAAPSSGGGGGRSYRGPKRVGSAAAAAAAGAGAGGAGGAAAATAAAAAAAAPPPSARGGAAWRGTAAAAAACHPPPAAASTPPPDGPQQQLPLPPHDGGAAADERGEGPSPDAALASLPRGAQQGWGGPPPPPPPTRRRRPTSGGAGRPRRPPSIVATAAAAAPPVGPAAARREAPPRATERHLQRARQGGHERRQHTEEGRCHELGRAPHRPAPALGGATDGADGRRRRRVGAHVGGQNLDEARPKRRCRRRVERRRGEAGHVPVAPPPRAVRQQRPRGAVAPPHIDGGGNAGERRRLTGGGGARGVHPHRQLHLGAADDADGGGEAGEFDVLTSNGDAVPGRDLLGGGGGGWANARAAAPAYGEKPRLGVSVGDHQARLCGAAALTPSRRRGAGRGRAAPGVTYHLESHQWVEARHVQHSDAVGGHARGCDGNGGRRRRGSSGGGHHHGPSAARPERHRSLRRVRRPHGRNKRSAAGTSAAPLTAGVAAASGASGPRDAGGGTHQLQGGSEARLGGAKQGGPSVGVLRLGRGATEARRAPRESSLVALSAVNAPGPQGQRTARLVRSLAVLLGYQRRPTTRLALLPWRAGHTVWQHGRVTLPCCRNALANVQAELGRRKHAPRQVTAPWSPRDRLQTHVHTNGQRTHLCLEGGPLAATSIAGLPRSNYAGSCAARYTTSTPQHGRTPLFHDAPYEPTLWEQNRDPNAISGIPHPGTPMWRRPAADQSPPPTTTPSPPPRPLYHQLPRASHLMQRPPLADNQGLRECSCPLCSGGCRDLVPSQAVTERTSLSSTAGGG